MPPGPGEMSVPVSPFVLSRHPSAKLKRIDLSSSSISFIHNDAFRLLPALQDLILSENQLAALPALPSGIEFLDVRLNRLQSSGIQPDAFVVSQDLSPPPTTHPTMYHTTQHPPHNTQPTMYPDLIAIHAQPWSGA